MRERYRGSEACFQDAQRVLPGGVNSPVRAFHGVGGTPIFVARANGPHFWDVDGHRYIDYVLSWGPLILGHAHPAVVEALTNQITKGTSYGAPTELETQLAEQVIRMIPSIEQVRLVNSGTEATMSALRLARAYTGRQKIVKLSGCYHGHVDALLVQAGSGVATLGLPESPGIPPSTIAHTIVAEYNDGAAVEAIFNDHGQDIAAVIVEPVAGNMGLIKPEPGFLNQLRELTTRYGALLIFDEVMTGFRVARGGAQERWNVVPDLTCLGKVIGGGLPVGAYGGKREIMQHVAPAGPMYQAGTLSGNPLAMVAGLVTLQYIAQEAVFDQIVARTRELTEGLQAIADEVGIPMQIDYAGTMFGAYFLKEGAERIVDYRSAQAGADPQRYAKFFWAMADRGVYFAPSQFESGFMSLAHTQIEVQETLDAARAAMMMLRSA